MAVAAVITNGVGPGGSVPYLLTGGFGDFSGSPPPPPPTMKKVEGLLQPIGKLMR